MFTIKFLCWFNSASNNYVSYTVLWLNCQKKTMILWYIVIPVASVWSAGSTCFHPNRGHQTSVHLSTLMLAYESPSQSSLQNKALCVCQKMSSGLICGGQVDLFVPSSKSEQKLKWMGKPMWGLDKIMFGQRRRRWANIESTLGQRIAFAGNAWYQLYTYF